MCSDNCGDGRCECRLFRQELSECLESGKEPTVTIIDAKRCGGSYARAQFEVTLPSGRALWMRICDADEYGLHDALSEYACNVLRVVDCPKQAAAVDWLEYCSKLHQVHKHEIKALKEEALSNEKSMNSMIQELEVDWDKMEGVNAKAIELEAELSQLQSDVAKAAACAENIAKGYVSNETQIKRKPLKCLDAALKIIKSRLNAAGTAAAPAPTKVLAPSDDTSAKEADTIRAENEALKARIATLSQELDAERTLSGTQAEELDRLRATVKKQEKLDKKIKKKGGA